MKVTFANLPKGAWFLAEGQRYTKISDSHGRLWGDAYVMPFTEATSVRWLCPTETRHSMIDHTFDSDGSVIVSAQMPDARVYKARYKDGGLTYFVTVNPDTGAHSTLRKGMCEDIRDVFVKVGEYVTAFYKRSRAFIFVKNGEHFSAFGSDFVKISQDTAVCVDGKDIGSVWVMGDHLRTHVYDSPAVIAYRGNPISCERGEDASIVCYGEHEGKQHKVTFTPLKGGKMNCFRFSSTTPLELMDKFEIAAMVFHAS